MGSGWPQNSRGFRHSPLGYIQATRCRWKPPKLPNTPTGGHIPSISPKKMAAKIDCLNTRKVLGTDKITASILQEFPRKAILQLTDFFNNSLELMHFPQSWKFSRITMLLNPGKPPELVTSYRPISLFSTVTKLWEKFLDHSYSSLIPEHQFGLQ